MADQAKIDRDWDDGELDAIVADYFAMLHLERAGQSYVKAHRAAALMAQIGRTHRSVEFKHMNISAVLSELGLPTIRGYKPSATSTPTLPSLGRSSRRYPGSPRPAACSSSRRRR
jgi:hypothetical protein